MCRFQDGPGLSLESAEEELLAGVDAWRSGRRDRAFTHLQMCIHLDPQSPQRHEWMGQWFAQEGMVEHALRHGALALELAPNDQGILISHACVLEVAGDLDAARALVQRLVNAGCTRPRLASLYGRMARWRPEAGSALAMIEQALEVGSVSPAEKSGLHFAAAGSLDSLGRYDSAFDHAVQANQLAGPADDPSSIAWTVQNLMAYFTRPRLRGLPRATYRSEKPVFLVGMPRSGSSLVEQILASHPLIHGAGELDFMDRIALGAMDMLGCGPLHYPRCLDRLTIDQADGLAQLYIDPLSAMSPHALRITDKMLHNFLHLGLIEILLPQARVIHCRRDPLDTCLSCFMTHFTVGHEFSRNLACLGLYYRQYERLMAHWKGTLDLPILEVNYEDLVSDLESEIRRMLEFLELPWDPRCMRFHETRRPVATASVQQVRRPIYRDSIGRSKNYEKHLAGLRNALDRGSS